ncbi:MAG: hypothetical protein NC223_10500 [Butyrivibrio sp.]|nr:hypothetical protein [Butyrivibrio sp.]
MKKIIPLLFIVLFTFTACGKSESTESDSDRRERERRAAYLYETPFVFSDERAANGVEYIENIDVLVDEAVKIIRGRMQKGHNTGDWMDGVWDSGLGYNPTDFDGRGYYICRIPITTYDNNLNALLDSFTLLILNEDKTIAGDASFSGFDDRKMKADMMPTSVYFGALKAAPDMEFINIHAYYLRGDPNPNPNLMGGIDPYAEACDMLGDDNKVYIYDYSADKIKEVNKLNRYGLNSYIIEGDLFHALPEEMRYSFDKIMDNLIWVEY